jgi:hypothetical protein
VREKEIERGVNVESRGTQLAYKGDQWGNWGVRVTWRKEMNGRKLRRGDRQHTHMNLTNTWKGDIQRRGLGGFWSTLHWRVVANLGFNKPLGFDNQTLFCFVLRF